VKQAALVFVLVLTACATDQAFVTGREMIEQGRVEEGLQRMEAAAKANPGNIEYRAAYLRERDKYLNALLTQGDKQRLLGKAQEAQAFYRRALGLDSANARARSGLA
jgi:general secretion pathway protein D